MNKLLRPENSGDVIVTQQKEIMRRFSATQEKKLTYFGQILARGMAEFFNDPDPYAELKFQYNQKALRLIPLMYSIIDKGKDNIGKLTKALKLSILGNTVDFGTPHKINLESDMENYESIELSIDHTPKLFNDLKNAKKILVLGDNCGEIVFDRVLLEIFHQIYPKIQYLYAVRSDPVLNDITIRDIAGIEIPSFVSIIEASQSPGILMEQCDQRFTNEFSSADIILSKGQGNFESLNDFLPKDASLYFMLKAKCPYVAKLLNVPLESLVFAKQDPKVPFI